MNCHGDLLLNVIVWLLMALSTSRSRFWVYLGHQKSQDQGHLKVISRKSLKKCCMGVKNLYNKLRSQLQRFMRLNVSAVRCPSGWRSTPGKRVYGHPVSGVRIPLSPPLRKQHQAAFFVSAPRKILTKPLRPLFFLPTLDSKPLIYRICIFVDLVP